MYWVVEEIYENQPSSEDFVTGASSTYICKEKSKLLQVIIHLELIHTSEFFKQLNLHEPLWQVQFQFLEKLTSIN